MNELERIMFASEVEERERVRNGIEAWESVRSGRRTDRSDMRHLSQFVLMGMGMGMMNEVLVVNRVRNEPSPISIQKNPAKKKQKNKGIRKKNKNLKNTSSKKVDMSFTDPPPLQWSRETTRAYASPFSQITGKRIP